MAMLATRPRFALSVAEPASVSNRPIPNSVSSPTVEELGPIRVLVVDDDQMMRSAVAELLSELGFLVIGQAENGERGVSLAAELRPDVTLMDPRMRGIDGIEATRRIRRADALAQVVIYSAYSDAGFQEGAEEAGVSCYLVKGRSPRIIADVIRSVGSLGRELDDRAMRARNCARTAVRKLRGPRHGASATATTCTRRSSRGP